MKKKYVLPGLWEHHEILIPFLSLYQNNKQYFYDDIEFEAVFGNFSHIIWDGGRCPEYNQYFSFLEDILQIQYIYNEILNISMRFVCSNLLIQPQDCYDKFGNLILKYCENSKNSIIIGSSCLENYIRKTYPKYHFISSTTKCIQDDIQIIKELQKDYIYTCISYKKNHDIEFLKTIPNNLLQKVELLVNERCDLNCNKRQQHYLAISQSNYSYNMKYCDDFSCYKKNRNIFISTQINYINLNKYIALGINHFKLQGRWSPSIDILIEDLLQYCIKLDYQDIIFNQLKIWANNFDLYNYKLEDYKIN